MEEGVELTVFLIYCAMSFSMLNLLIPSCAATCKLLLDDNAGVTPWFELRMLLTYVNGLLLHVLSLWNIVC